MNWDNLRYFLAVARTGSLTDASRILGASQSTVSRRIDAFERDLADALFVRCRDGYGLTPLGQWLLPEAEAVEARVESLSRNAGAGFENAKGTVRIATPELIAHELIVPALAAFHTAHPDIEIELTADVRPIRLARQEADIVVRGVRPSQGNYTMRKVGEIAVGLFVSEGYVQRCGRPRTADDLDRHTLIGWDREHSFLAMAGWLESATEGRIQSLRTNTFTSQMVACREGYGLAALPIVIGRRYGLIKVLDCVPDLVLDLWLLLRADARKIKRVQVVSDFLQSMFDSIDSAPRASLGPGRHCR